MIHMEIYWGCFFNLQFMKTERRPSGVFIINFEQILYSALVFPILTLNK